MQKPSTHWREVFLLGLVLAIGLFAAGCYVRAVAGPGYADFEVDGPPPPPPDPS